MERVMKLQDVILKAMANKITWMEAAKRAHVSSTNFRHRTLVAFGTGLAPFILGESTVGIGETVVPPVDTAKGIERLGKLRIQRSR
jgi:hypothetical protein